VHALCGQNRRSASKSLIVLDPRACRDGWLSPSRPSGGLVRELRNQPLFQLVNLIEEARKEVNHLGAMLESLFRYELEGANCGVRA
jgi:hypothetical protein